MTERYTNYNPNPDTSKHTRGKKKGKKISHSDCVVRAFTKVWNCDWFEAYKRLYERGLELFDMPNNEIVWKSFLKQDHSLSTMKETSTGRRRRLNVSEVAEQTAGKRGVLVCRCAHHVVAISNGKYYDSWDSGEETVYTVWRLA